MSCKLLGFLPKTIKEAHQYTFFNNNDVSCSTIVVRMGIMVCLSKLTKIEDINCYMLDGEYRVNQQKNQHKQSECLNAYL